MSQLEIFFICCGSSTSWLPWFPEVVSGSADPVVVQGGMGPGLRSLVRSGSVFFCGPSSVGLVGFSSSLAGVCLFVFGKQSGLCLRTLRLRAGGGSAGTSVSAGSVVSSSTVSAHLRAVVGGCSVDSPGFPSSSTASSSFRLMCDNATAISFIKLEGVSRLFPLTRSHHQSSKVVRRQGDCTPSSSSTKGPECTGGLLVSSGTGLGPGVGDQPFSSGFDLSRFGGLFRSFSSLRSATRRSTSSCLLFRIPEPFLWTLCRSCSRRWCCCMLFRRSSFCL